ncbi:MAG TPA: hypothetical protein VGH28_17665 [Polyangiaceae bacterium]
MTTFDFVPVAQPELARAGRDLTVADRATVHTARGNEKVDAKTIFKVDTPDGKHFGPWPLRQTTIDCSSNPDCKLTQPGTYTVSKPHQRIDGGKVTSYVLGSVAVTALSGLVAEHFVCFSDPTCQDTARTGLVVTDVALGATALAAVLVVGFVAAIMRGLNN